MGVFLAVVWGIAEEARRRSPRVREMVAVAGAAILIFMTVVAREQAGYWRDGETLLRRAIEGTDGNWVAHNLLGAELGRQGRTAEALECFREAIRVNPGYTDARFNLGVALDETGDAEGAMREYRATIALRPEHARARINLGGLLNQAGRLDEAAVQFREALRIHPGSAEAYNNQVVAICWGNSGSEGFYITRYGGPHGIKIYMFGEKRAGRLQEVPFLSQTAPLPLTFLVPRWSLSTAEGAVTGSNLRVESNHDLHGRAYKADANGSRQYGLL